MSSISIAATEYPFPDLTDDAVKSQWLVVTSGSELLGIPLEQVREVVRLGGLQSVPGSPDIQAGIVNVRGRIVTVFDLHSLRTGCRAQSPGSIVLLQHGTRIIGITVDKVHDVEFKAGDGTEGSVDTAERSVPIVHLDAAALCAAHLHSVEENGT